MGKLGLGFLTLSVLLLGSNSYAQPKAAYYYTHKHKTHGSKPLLKYPNENPAYIVTYNEEDLQKMRLVEQARSLSEHRKFQKENPAIFKDLI